MPLVTLAVARVELATPRARLLTLDLGGHRLEFAAGQAIMAAAHGHPERRPYSIACSPERASASDRIQLLVALDPGPDQLSGLAHVVRGDAVDVEGPLGAFTFPAVPAQTRVLFVAGGAGIAPLRAMLDHALRRTDAPAMSLLYSARRSDEFAFIEEFRDFAARGRIELHQTVTREDNESWAGSRGRIGRSHFQAVLHEPADTLCFVCGPPPLVTESVATLSALGVPSALIRTEQWGR